MSKLFLDFETKDMAIQESLGSGWCYKDKLEILGYAYAVDDSEVNWSHDIALLESLVNNSSEIICHNANYDIGILKMLNIPYNTKIISCTLLLSKLFYNGFHSYSLDFLSSKWLGEKKLNSELGELAKSLGLVKSKAQDAEKVAKKNMDVLFTQYPDAVIKYAKQDIKLTRDLYNKVSSNEYPWLSDLIKCVIDIRHRGVLISIPNLLKSRDRISFLSKESKEKMDIYLCGKNPNSSKQLGEVCTKLGIEPPTTDKGNPSFNKKSCATLTHPLFIELGKYKTLQKLKTAFIDSTIEMLKKIYSCDEGTLELLPEARIHPELHIFGATATGRFSSSNLNIQQIPKHNELGKLLVRGMFIPEQGESWYCLDFSSQEPRMQVHFASRIGSESGQLMAFEWRNDPEFDMHQYVANMMEVDRKKAKTINLGLSYGMGTDKLAASLGLQYSQAIYYKELYHEKAPYLKELTDACKRQILKNGYIKTLAKRKLYKDPSMKVGDKVQDWSYKAINKLIQGSSADQTMLAMVEAYRRGIKIGYPIHDEITISCNNVESVLQLKEVMENVIQLEVPSRSEVTVGDTFADQSPIMDGVVIQKQLRKEWGDREEVHN